MTESLDDRIKKIELRKEGKFIGRNGLLHCIFCNKPLQQRVVRQNRIQIEPIACDCENKIKHMELEKRRQDAFLGSAMTAYRYDNSIESMDGTTATIKKFIRKFLKMKEKGIGLYLYSNSANVNNFHIGRIGNALIDRNYTVKHFTVPFFMSLMRNKGADLAAFYKNLSLEYDAVLLSGFYMPEDDTETRFVYSLLELLIGAGIVLIIFSDENIADIEPATYFGRKFKAAVAGHCIPIQLSDNNSTINLKDFAEKELWIFKEVEDEEQK